MPNRLASETSPYLLQHRLNPVDWYPWGAEALARARELDRPILLSIGYAACHWCHVMERESFEDEAVARFLNGHFVPIKVDREERPDLDEIYMTAVQLMTGSGGWPLNVFLTPETRPFFGGTYFPPESRHGRIGFLELLERVHEAWTTRRDELLQSAGTLTERIVEISATAGAEAGEARAGRLEIARAVGDLTRRFDPPWGGFGGAPKFPPDGALALLLREHERTGETVPLEIAERTLEGMALGGIYDHVGGGFARYSVDERWLVPHFEKMLYNQALLVPLYADAWRLTGKPLYRRVVEQTLDFVRRELTDPAGGFHSSLDADSEGHEGRFYVWSPDELRAVLGDEDAAFYAGIYDVTPHGNFEGRNIPNLLGGSLAVRATGQGSTEEALVARLEPLRLRLLEARGARVRPATDDKVLTAWNGLAISAFARAHACFGRPEDLRAATAAADFVLGTLATGDRLRASWREGRSALAAYLDDHAFLCRGLVDLYEACFEARYLEAAGRFARSMLAHFADVEGGGLFFTADDHEPLLARTRSLHDGALPSGAGVAAEVLLRLSVHLDAPDLRDAAHRTLRAASPRIRQVPGACLALLLAADLDLGPRVDVAIVGTPGDETTRALLSEVRRRYLPRLALAAGPPGVEVDGVALLRGRTSGPAPAAHVCRDAACELPVSDPATLGRLLERASKAR